jgi:hypothetical protein
MPCGTQPDMLGIAPTNDALQLRQSNKQPPAMCKERCCIKSLCSIMAPTVQVGALLLYKRTRQCTPVANIREAAAQASKKNPKGQNMSR